MKGLRGRDRAFAFFGGIALVAGGLMLMLASGRPGPRTATVQPDATEAIAPIVVTEAEQQSQPPAVSVEHTANVVRIQIGRIHVDAPVVKLGVDAAGIMQSPST